MREAGSGEANERPRRRAQALATHMFLCVLSHYLYLKRPPVCLTAMSPSPRAADSRNAAKFETTSRARVSFQTSLGDVCFQMGLYPENAMILDILVTVTKRYAPRENSFHISHMIIINYGFMHIGRFLLARVVSPNKRSEAATQSCG